MMKNALKFHREKANLSAEQLAQLASTSRQQIYRLEKDERTLTPDWAERLAPHLDTKPSNLIFDADEKSEALLSSFPGPSFAVGVRGSVAAGAWLEADDVFFEEDEQVPVMRDERFPMDAYFALRVKGNSINQIAKDGQFIICLDLIKSGIAPRIGDVVVVQRSRDDGRLIETTAKVLKRRGQSWELWPASDDPKYQDPLPYRDFSNAAHTEVRIIAVVVGTYWSRVKQGVELPWNL